MDDKMKTGAAEAEQGVKLEVGEMSAEADAEFSNGREDNENE